MSGTSRSEIRVREVHYNPNVWPPPKAFPSPDIDQSNMRFVSEEISSRKLVEAFAVDQLIYDRINAAYGTNFQLRRQASRAPSQHHGKVVGVISRGGTLPERR